MAELPVKPTLDVEVPDDVDDLEHDDRRALAWALVMRGWTKKAAAERCGVSRQTVTKWIDQEARRRRSLVGNIDDEVERMVGQLEALAQESWEAHRRIADSDKANAMVGPQYLRLVLDIVKEIGRLRGIEKPGGDIGRKHVEVVVTIGGATPTIAVGTIEDADVVVEDAELVDATS